MNNNNQNNRPAPKRGNPRNNNRGPAGGQLAPVRKTSGQTATGRPISRGAALRAQKMSVQDANRVASQYLDAASKQGDKPRPLTSPRPGRANVIDDSPRLKIIGLG